MFLDLEFMPWAAEKTQVSLLLFDQIDYLTWKIPLSPSTPTLYLNFVWGGKQNKPPPPIPRKNLGVCIQPISRQTTETSWSHDWLIDCYWREGARNPVHSRTQAPSVFTSLRNYRCQNQFITLFTHRVGWAGWKVHFSLRIPSTSFCWFLHAVFTWWVKSSDRRRSVLLPLHIKQQGHNLG